MELHHRPSAYEADELLLLHSAIISLFLADLSSRIDLAVYPRHLIHHARSNLHNPSQYMVYLIWLFLFLHDIVPYYTQGIFVLLLLLGYNNCFVLP